MRFRVKYETERKYLGMDLAHDDTFDADSWDEAKVEADELAAHQEFDRDVYVTVTIDHDDDSPELTWWIKAKG